MINKTMFLVTNSLNQTMFIDNRIFERVGLLGYDQETFKNEYFKDFYGDLTKLM